MSGFVASPAREPETRRRSADVEPPGAANAKRLGGSDDSSGAQAEMNAVSRIRAIPCDDTYEGIGLGVRYAAGILEVSTEGVLGGTSAGDGGFYIGLGAAFQLPLVRINLW